MTPREEHLEKIRKIKMEFKLARPGPHKKDLRRQLLRLQKELKTYDMYMKEKEVR